MRILVWQWGRFGAGPRVAVELADGLRAAGADSVILSLAESAEILGGSIGRPRCELTVRTYDTVLGFGRRLLTTRLSGAALARKVAAWAPQLAICAMPALLDDAMTDVLGRLGIPTVAMIHDAELHPGDGIPLQMLMQKRLMRRADALMTLSPHVEAIVRAQVGTAKPMLRTDLPPFSFGPMPPPPRAHGGKPRLLFFGRLLPYKGLDLLADALHSLDGERFETRIVGYGPETASLASLRALAGVTVENRWVPEGELGALLAWADALVLPYREASQSGVAAAAISARRWVVATAVGGLVDQFGAEPLARLCRPEPAAIAAALTSLIDAPPRDVAHQPTDAFVASNRDLLRSLDELFGPFPAVGLAHR